jgi:hypothetical protein
MSVFAGEGCLGPLEVVPTPVGLDRGERPEAGDFDALDLCFFKEVPFVAADRLP